MGRHVARHAWALVLFQAQASFLPSLPTLHSTPECCQESRSYLDENATSSLPNGAFVASARDCQNICAASRSCESFTYKEQGSPAGVLPSLAPGGCYLFDVSNKTLRHEEGYISGPKRCPGRKRWHLPFNVSFPTHWMPVSKEAPHPKVNKTSLGDRMKATFQGMKHTVQNLETCSGPTCCPGSTCHFEEHCYANRGTTRCVGASFVPFKWGTCECLTGACSRSGFCGDAPAQQKFEISSVEAEPGKRWNGAAAGAAAAGVAGALLASALVAARRSLRRRTQLPLEARLQGPPEPGLAE